jgi:hypothetical protein
MMMMMMMMMREISLALNKFCFLFFEFFVFSISPCHLHSGGGGLCASEEKWSRVLVRDWSTKNTRSMIKAQQKKQKRVVRQGWLS